MDHDEEPMEYAPNMKVDGGLMCFLDNSRECGPDCMAFLGFGQEADTQNLSPQQRQCLLISSVEKIGRFSGIIAKILYDDSVAAKKAAADSRRTEGLRPPGPMDRPPSGKST